MEGKSPKAKDIFPKAKGKSLEAKGKSPQAKGKTPTWLRVVRAGEGGWPPSFKC